MGMPSAQVQAGTQPQMGQFMQNSQFTTGMGSGPPNQPVPLNFMNLPVVGPSQESRDAAFATQNAELQARIARRASAAATGAEPTFSVTGWDAPGSETPFTAGGGATATQMQSQMTSQPSVGPQSQPGLQSQPTTQSKGKGFAQPVNPPTQGNISQVMRQDGLDQNAINADPAGFQSWQQRRQAQQPQQMQSSQGKGSTTNAATSGQPTYGQPNRYPNTVGQWDNASIQRQSPTGGGKGKG